MKGWIKTVKQNEIKDKLTVRIGEKEIVFFQLADGIYALDNMCSHSYARLSEGEVWDDQVYCPKHGSAFAIKTGAVAGLPATQPVKSYVVKNEAGSIYIKDKGEEEDECN